jgi:hypothetical protein
MYHLDQQGLEKKENLIKPTMFCAFAYMVVNVRSMTIKVHGNEQRPVD